jgi:hypothetical protein
MAIEALRGAQFQQEPDNAKPDGQDHATDQEDYNLEDYGPGDETDIAEHSSNPDYPDVDYSED